MAISQDHLTPERKKALRIAKLWLAASLAGRKLNIIDENEPLNTNESVLWWYELVQSFWYIRIMQFCFIMYYLIIPFCGNKAFHFFFLKVFLLFVHISRLSVAPLATNLRPKNTTSVGDELCWEEIRRHSLVNPPE